MPESNGGSAGGSRADLLVGPHGSPVIFVDMAAKGKAGILENPAIDDDRRRARTMGSRPTKQVLSEAATKVSTSTRESSKASGGERN